MPSLEPGKKLPDDLLDAEVRDAAGETNTLRELSRGKLTLMVFLRHFGCIGCSQQLDVLVPILEGLGAMGVSVLLVGNGEPRYIPAFIERQRLDGYPLTIVTDESLRSHGAAGFVRSFWATYGPRAIWADIRAIGQGYQMAARQGDALQQGGALIVDAKGRLIFHRATDAAPEPVPAAEILDAIVGHIGQRAAVQQKGLL